MAISFSRHVSYLNTTIGHHVASDVADAQLEYLVGEILKHRADVAEWDMPKIRSSVTAGQG